MLKERDLEQLQNVADWLDEIEIGADEIYPDEMAVGLPVMNGASRTIGLAGWEHLGYRIASQKFIVCKPGIDEKLYSIACYISENFMGVKVIVDIDPDGMRAVRTCADVICGRVTRNKFMETILYVLSTLEEAEQEYIEKLRKASKIE